MKHCLFILLLAPLAFADVYTDNFNRSNRNLVNDGSWIDFPEVSDDTIISNVVYGQTSIRAGALYNGTYGNAQYSRATITGTYVGVAVRIQTDYNSGYTLMRTTGTAYELYRFDANTPTTLASYSGVADGDSLTLGASNDSLFVYRNAICVDTAVDNTYTTGKVGLRAYDNTGTCDNWSGGTFTAGAAAYSSPFSNKKHTVTAHTGVRVGHVGTWGTTDSMKIIGSHIDTISMVDYDAKDSIYINSQNKLTNYILHLRVYDGTDSADNYDTITATWDSVRIDSVLLKKGTYSTLANDDTVHNTDTLRLKGYWKALRGLDSLYAFGKAMTKIDSSDTQITGIIATDASTGWGYFVIADTVSSDTCTKPDSVYNAGIYEEPEPDSFTVAAYSGGNGTVSKTPNLNKVQSGDSVSFGSTASMHYHFLKWSGTFSSASTPMKRAIVSNTVDTAYFGIDTFHISNTTDAHCTITYQGDSTGAYGETVRLYCTAGAGYTFTWPGGAGVTADTLDVYVTKDSTVVASSNILVRLDSIISHPRRDSLKNVARRLDTLFHHGAFGDSASGVEVWLNSTGTEKCTLVSWSSSLTKSIVPVGSVRGYRRSRIKASDGTISTNPTSNNLYIKVPGRY